MNTTTIKLRDKVSRCYVWITVRDDKVVGAMGSDPHRFVGLTEARARHVARYGGS